MASKLLDCWTCPREVSTLSLDSLKRLESLSIITCIYILSIYRSFRHEGKNGGGPLLDMSNVQQRSKANQ